MDVLTTAPFTENDIFCLGFIKLHDTDRAVTLDRLAMTTGISSLSHSVRRLRGHWSVGKDLCQLGRKEGKLIC
jgi:hypothetical protein